MSGEEEAPRNRDEKKDEVKPRYKHGRGVAGWKTADREKRGGSRVYITMAVIEEVEPGTRTEGMLGGTLTSAN